MSEENAVVAKDCEEHVKKCEQKRLEEEQKYAECLAVEERKNQFFIDLEKSDDLNNNLEALANFL
jgi:hypothetical protein